MVHLIHWHPQKNTNSSHGWAAQYVPLALYPQIPLRLVHKLTFSSMCNDWSNPRTGVRASIPTMVRTQEHYVTLNRQQAAQDTNVISQRLRKHAAARDKGHGSRKSCMHLSYHSMQSPINITQRRKATTWHSNSNLHLLAAACFCSTSITVKSRDVEHSPS